MRKKLVSMLLALTLLCSALPVPAFAEDEPGTAAQTVTLAETTPAEGETTPNQGETTPAQGETVPAEGETTPNQGENTPAEGENTPAEGENTPNQGKTTPAQGETTPAAQPSLLGLDDEVSPLAASLTELVVGGTTVVENSQTTTSGDGWTYDVGSNTLTLKDATINGTSSANVGAGIYAEGDLTIKLEGTNTVTGADAGTNGSNSIRVNSGNLTIQGGGSLTAQGEDSEGSSYGICVMGSFTQEGGSVTATGGTSQNYYSAGLYVYGSPVTVQGGTLTATGGNAANNYRSYGIYARGTVTVNDATVTAIGGTGSYSYGIYIESSSPSVTLSDNGSLTARSGSATSKAGGIYFYDYDGSTGSVTVENGSTLLTNSVILKGSSTENPLAPTGGGSWLIYGQNGQGTPMQGDVTLTEDLTIESGNTFTIPAGGTLNLGGHTLTNNGTLTLYSKDALTNGTLAGDGSFVMASGDPVLKEDTLTYTGSDQFSQLQLVPPTGTVDDPVLGKTFTYADNISIDGWNLETQEIKNAGTYTLTAKHTDGRTSQKQVTVSKATTSIEFNNYAPGKPYDGTALANPTAEQLTITGAGYNDVTFTWYKDSVADANKLDSAPTDAGTCYLVASIPESTNIIGSEATSGAITISPATISIASATVQDKTYDGTTDATVDTVAFNGLVEGESLTLNTDYTATATFDNANAGDSKQATVTVTLQNGNYTFVEGGNTAAATAKIAPLPVVLEWSTPTTFTYDKAEHSVTATVTNKVGDDTFNLTYEGNRPPMRAPTPPPSPAWATPTTPWRV